MPAPTPPPAPASKPATDTVASLDLPALEQRLRDTRAIGVFTKLTLKNQVDDLLDRFRRYHRGQSDVKLDQLRQSYDGLMLKVLSLLQDKDAALAHSISVSREPLWNILVDPKKFASIG